ncbi:hypothetical protein ACJX0J_036222, partial [Zea mays]
LQRKILATIKYYLVHEDAQVLVITYKVSVLLYGYRQHAGAWVYIEALNGAVLYILFFFICVFDL